MAELRIGLIGPLPPPSGGMANQTRQLARLLKAEGASVEVVQVNAPYQPAWVGRLRGIRALFRLLPYLFRLWIAAGRVSLFHVMANSGWSWHLFTAPAVWVGWLRGIPVIVNYRGGEAEEFFLNSFRLVRPTLNRASAIIVPSGFLAELFERYRFPAIVIPNIIDIQRFTAISKNVDDSRNILVTRNLEPIYDIATALQAFHRIYGAFPEATLTVCGTGPERERLEELCDELGISRAVTFTGTVDNDKMAALYRSTGVMLNTSLVDNMPISILEALASGVPVVSTDAGGIPYMVKHGSSALLVSPRDDAGMAEAIALLFRDRQYAEKLSREGLIEVQQYTWPAVKKRLFAVYQSVLTKAVHGEGEQDVT